MYDPTATWHHFRQRAQESRSRAGECEIPIIRDIYVGLAATFDALAQWAEEFIEATRCAGNPPSDPDSAPGDVPAAGSVSGPDIGAAPGIVERSPPEPAAAKAGPKPGGHRPARRRLESRSPLPGLDLGDAPRLAKDRL